MSASGTSEPLRAPILSGRRRQQALGAWRVVRGERGALAALGALFALAAALHLTWARGSVPAAEELGWAQQYENLGSEVLSLWSGWFDPLARLTYNAFFATVGVEDYLPYLVMGVVANLSLAAAVYWYCRTLVRPWTGVLIAAVLLFLGPASSTLLWPLNTLNALGMATLPAAMVLLGRRTRRADGAALAVLVVGLGFSGPVVVGVCLGVAVFLLAERPFDLRRLVVPAIPLAVYALATLALPGRQDTATPVVDNLFALPRYAVDSAGATMAAMMGLAGGEMAGGALALGALAAVLLVPRLDPDARRRIIGLAGAALAAWLLIGVARAHFDAPDGSRYLILGGVPLLLAGVELSRVIPRGWRVGLAAALILATVVNAQALERAGAFIRDLSDTSRAQLGAMELAIDHAPPTFIIIDSPVLVWVVAGYWREARERVGTFALSPEELPRAAPGDRQAADRVLIQAGSLQRSAPGPAPAARGSCERGPALRLSLDRGPVTVAAVGDAPVQVVAWRFADAPVAESAVVVYPGQATTIRPLPDASPVPWKVAVLGSARVCPVA